MTLDKKTKQFIYNIVKKEPQTIQTIAHTINKSWITAERYIQKLIEEDGIIDAKTFRGGTRGALKIVYWNQYTEHESAIQQRIKQQILSGIHKIDFSPSMIYQFAEKKSLFSINENEYKKQTNFKSLKELLLSANDQILMFSGNLSFIHITDGEKTIADIIEQIAKSGIPIKIICRVELPGIKNIAQILAINERIGKDMITIRHTVQPLRVDIIDNTILSMAETLDPGHYPKEELKKHMRIIYRVQDEEWVRFMQKLFWEMFHSSIDAKKRIAFLKEL